MTYMDTSDDLVVDNFYRANFESLYRGTVPVA